MDERITNRGIQRAIAKVENGKSEQFYATALNSNRVRAIVTHRRHWGLYKVNFSTQRHLRRAGVSYIACCCAASGHCGRR